MQIRPGSEVTLGVYEDVQGHLTAVLLLSAAILDTSAKGITLPEQPFCDLNLKSC